MTSDLSATASRHLWGHFSRLAPNEAPPVMVRGEGCYVWDDQGKRYLDGLAGLFTVQVGHGRIGGPDLRKLFDPGEFHDRTPNLAPVPTAAPWGRCLTSTVKKWLTPGENR